MFAIEGILKFAITYEPIWAIGTGKTTPQMAEEVHSYIR